MSPRGDAPVLVPPLVDAVPLRVPRSRDQERRRSTDREFVPLVPEARALVLRVLVPRVPIPRVLVPRALAPRVRVLLRVEVRGMEYRDGLRLEVCPIRLERLAVAPRLEVERTPLEPRELLLTPREKPLLPRERA